MADYFLDAQDYTFQPYNTDTDGDSGELYLASLKTDPAIRYVVKGAYLELACNEFMYHHTAKALGLHTQEVKLFLDTQFRYAAGIRYATNARRADFEKDIKNDAVRLGDSIAFQALYVILDENDSHEQYIDEEGRLFKLDNAASFKIGEFDLLRIQPLSKKQATSVLAHKLGTPEYMMYGSVLEQMTERHGDQGRNACLSLFERFSNLDETLLFDALDALSEVYPPILCDYYYSYVMTRKELCAQFLGEVEKET